MNATRRWTHAHETSGFGLDEFLPVLLGLNKVTEVELRTVERGPSLQGRVADVQLRALADQARTRYHDSGIPFWDALMTLAIEKPLAVRTAIFEQALYHRTEDNGQGDEKFTASDFIRRLTTDGYHEASPRGIRALTSRVETPSGVSHLPLLDFRLAPSAHHTHVVTELLTILGIDGYVVDSGRSYHFYGAQCLQERDYWSFLGKAQLMSPFVDERWIAHQLISGKSALRVSTNRERHQTPPRLVAWSERLPTRSASTGP